jgi:predicted esterase
MAHGTKALSLALLLLMAGTPAFADDPTCSADGAPPFTTVTPVTVPLLCPQGELLSFEQEGVRRYACLNLPRQARAGAQDHQWPLVIYLHGSRTTPESLYLSGRDLFDLQDTYPLSDNPEVKGFILLSPEGRRADPWQSVTGKGFHWDEWYRNPDENLDALAIDHFLDEVVSTGLVDPDRIYVFGWSNGAYMTALYGIWRSDRIAAMAQYAGADPWSRTPCPVTQPASREVPLFLLRNLCDALVPCSTTSEWIETLTEEDWPFEYRNLSLRGRIVSADRTCAAECSTARGIYEHVRWPNRQALRQMLGFLKEHPLP